MNNYVNKNNLSKDTNNSKRYKILFIPAWYPSEKSPVLGIFVKEYAKAVSLYNDVVVLYSEGVVPSLKQLFDVRDEIEDGIRTVRLRSRRSPIQEFSNLTNLWSIFSAFRKLVREGFKPDVIHAHVFSAGVVAVILGKIYDVPVVITEHFTGFSRKMLRRLQRLKAKFAFENASLVCPVSKNLKSHIESYGIRAKFKVVPNVVDTSLFFPPEVTRRERPKNDKKRILLVAILDPKKGIPYLLKGLFRLKEKRKDFILDIVGDGKNRYEYEKLSHKLGLVGIVHFHGRCTKEEVSKFMKQCDFVVLPSLYETFGVVLIEAMACGKPVIATNIGAPNEIITDNVGKLVPPANPKALSVAIDYMLNNYKEYSQKKIGRYARDNFSYESVGRILDRIYSNMVGKREIR
ncbi:glycosyltransferase [Thermodesulfobacteriota bacterium]